MMPSRSRGWPALLGLIFLAGCTSAVQEKRSALPSLDAQAQSERYAVIQRTLEHDPTGRTRVWGTPAGARGSVVLLGTVSSAIYGWCRNYEERIAVPPAANYRMVGIACRDPSGNWLVLDLRSFIETGA